MKRIQPVVIIPFSLFVVIGIVGLLILECIMELVGEALHVVGGWLSELFNVVIWLLEVAFYGFSYGGGLALITIGIFFLIKSFCNWKRYSSPYVLTIAAGLFIFSFGFDWAYSERFTRIVSTEQHIVTTVKWFFWKDSHIETHNVYANTWWFIASNIIHTAWLWMLIFSPIIFSVETLFNARNAVAELGDAKPKYPVDAGWYKTPGGIASLICLTLWIIIWGCLVSNGFFLIGAVVFIVGILISRFVYFGRAFGSMCASIMNLWR